MPVVRTNPPVNHVMQPRENQCWASCIKMLVDVLKPRAHEATVASIVEAILYKDENIGATDNVIKSGLERYRIFYRLENRALSFAEIQAEINNNFPVIVGVDWNTPEWAENSGHALVISGYDVANGINWLILNDPAENAETKVSFDALVRGNYQPGIHRGEGHAWNGSLIHTVNIPAHP